MVLHRMIETEYIILQVNPLATQNLRWIRKGFFQAKQKSGHAPASGGDQQVKILLIRHSNSSFVLTVLRTPPNDILHLTKRVVSAHRKQLHAVTPGFTILLALFSDNHLHVFRI